MYRFSLLRSPFFAKVVLLIIGISWCIAIFNRRHEDIEALKVSNDKVEKSVIVGFWIFTAFIAAAVCWGVKSLFGHIL